VLDVYVPSVFPCWKGNPPLKKSTHKSSRIKTENHPEYSRITTQNLVGGLEHFSFFHILGKIIPTDELIFFRGVGQLPTRNTFQNNVLKIQLEDPKISVSIVNPFFKRDFYQGSSRI
jgi:hypothetical protein